MRAVNLGSVLILLLNLIVWQRAILFLFSFLCLLFEKLPEPFSVGAAARRSRKTDSLYLGCVTRLP
jgi:hypothetical protein